MSRRSQNFDGNGRPTILLPGSEAVHVPQDHGIQIGFTGEYVVISVIRGTQSLPLPFDPDSARTLGVSLITAARDCELRKAEVQAEIDAMDGGKNDDLLEDATGRIA